MYSGFVGTVLSHFLSLISALWVILQIRKCRLDAEEINPLYLALLLIIGNSCLALVRYGNSDFGYKLRTFHIVTLNSGAILSFTIIKAVLHHMYKSPLIFLYLTLFNIIPFVRNVIAKDYKCKFYWSDILVGINGLVALLVCFLNENYNGVALFLSYLFGYFVIGDSGCFFDTELPSIDAFQYLSCFLNYFIMATVCF